MRIIKLEVEMFGSRGIEVAKYAVSLDQKRHYKIGRFVEYVKKICKLDNLSYELELDGFLISKYDRTKALKESLVYKLKISRGSNMNDQLRSSRVQNIGNERLIENKQRARDQLSKPKKTSKYEQMIEKARRKNRKEQSSDSQSSSSSSQEQGQSCSDSSIAEGQVQQKLLKKAKIISSSSSSSSSSSQSKQIPINKRHGPPLMPKVPMLNEPTAVIKKQIKQVHVPSSSSSSSSSSSQSEKLLPSLKQQQTVTISKNIQQYTNRFSKVTQASHKTRPNQAINPAQKPKLICGDSSSESQPSQYQPKKKAQIPSKTTEQQRQKPFQSTVVKPKAEVKLPPALRNKFVKKNFDKHKENQWINIEKDKIKKWKQLGNASICQPNNKIRFKIVELDQEKFIPVKSSWITAEVKEVHVNGIVSLIKVEQEGKSYRQTYELPQHNMDELQLYRLLATKEQLECFSAKEETVSKQDEQPKQSNKDNQVEVFETHEKNSLQKFICGQANYYFSDKNYNFDLFMQMHANRHPEKYLNISILLNFPKIKKFLKEEAKLYEYLKSDEKYAQRNYEIDFENRMIRKKVVIKVVDKKRAVEENNKPKDSVENVQINEQNPKQIQDGEQKGQVNS